MFDQRNVTVSELLLIIIKAFGFTETPCVRKNDIVDTYVLVRDMLDEEKLNIENISSQEIEIPEVDGALALLSKIGFISKERCGYALDDKGEVFLSDRLSSQEKIDLLKICIDLAKLSSTKRHLFALLLALKNSESLETQKTKINKLEKSYMDLKANLRKNKNHLK
ncbi:MAG: hypothetical protein ACP6IP_04445 [Candidatus Njordarchaeia archaeon]